MRESDLFENQEDTTPDRIAIMATDAIAFLQKLMQDNSDNYGMLTSIDNRITPLRMYLRSYSRNGQSSALIDMLKGDDYLASWRKENNLSDRDFEIE